MGSVRAEHELYDSVVAWLWPAKSALLCSRCCIPDHDGVAIPARRKPLAVRTERKRTKTPTVDCRKHLVRRARPWRDLGRLDFFCWHRKLANSWRCLLRGLLCKRGMSTERQRKTEKCKNFYDSIPHRFDPDDAASVQKRYRQHFHYLRDHSDPVKVSNPTPRGPYDGGITAGKVGLLSRSESYEDHSKTNTLPRSPLIAVASCQGGFGWHP